MHDRPPDPPDPPVPSLRAAIRVARVEEAERSRAVSDLRVAEVARLELLQDALVPVLAQVPAEVEMFDAGLVPGPHPRLFVDMIAHVEMGHDKRLYRFIQATRHGRAVLAESEHLDTIVDAVTAYIARRLVERDRALAAAEPSTPVRADAAAMAPRRARRTWIGTAAAILADYVGLAALVALAMALLRFAPWSHIVR